MRLQTNLSIKCYHNGLVDQLKDYFNAMKFESRDLYGRFIFELTK